MGKTTLATLRARSDGITPTQEGLGLAAALTKQAAHFLQDPVEHLLDDNGDDIEERVDAAHTHEHEEKVGHPVEALVFIGGALAADVIPKANGAEGNKAKVEGVQVHPSFHRGVHGRRTAGNSDG